MTAGASCCFHVLFHLLYVHRFAAFGQAHSSWTVIHKVEPPRILRKAALSSSSYTQVENKPEKNATKASRYPQCLLETDVLAGSEARIEHGDLSADDSAVSTFNLKTYTYLSTTALTPRLEDMAFFERVRGIDYKKTQQTEQQANSPQMKSSLLVERQPAYKNTQILRTYTCLGS